MKLSQKVSDLIYGMDVSHMFVENHGKDLTWLFVLISHRSLTNYVYVHVLQSEVLSHILQCIYVP